MNLKTIALALILGVAATANAAADKIIGYFPYWSQYSQFYPKDIRYDLVTHIHYASLSPVSDGSIAWTDENDIVNFKDLSKMSAENNVKLIVSVGGMEMEGTLQEIAASEEMRTTFAKSLSAWLAENGASGVEIDWQNLTADDASNYAALLQAISSEFAGKYSLSIATYPLVSGDAYSAEILGTVDYATVFMPDQMTEEESSLKPNQSVSSINEVLNVLTSKGIDKSKLIPVVFLYGKSFTGATGLGSSHTGIGSGNDGYIPYKELMVKFDTPDYKVSFDESSKSEYAVSSMEAIVFMGIPSVKALSEQVKNENYAGVAVYDLSQDHFEPLVSLLVTIGLELRPNMDYKPKKKN